MILRTRSFRRELACIILSLLTASAQAQPDTQPSDKPTSAPEAAQHAVGEQELQEQMKREEAPLKERQRRIDAELEALDHAALKRDEWAKDWAGTYYTGDGLGMNVSISVAPKSGLTYTWHGCLGLYDANHGDIIESFPGGLRLKLAIDETASSYRFMSTTLYFVRWGDRRYLVPETQMLRFVNNYNQGSFARESMYNIPLKHEKGEHPRRALPVPKELPELPKEYSKLLLTQPITLAITKVTVQPERSVTGNVKVVEARVELQGGKNQGVFLGMTLNCGKLLSRGSIVVDRVDDTTCSGKLNLFGSDQAELRPPQVGEEIQIPEPLPDFGLRGEEQAKEPPK